MQVVQVQVDLIHFWDFFSVSQLKDDIPLAVIRVLYYEQRSGPYEKYLGECEQYSN